MNKHENVFVKLNKNKHLQSGISLVEIMVSFSIMVGLFAGMGYLLKTVKQSAKSAEMVSERNTLFSKLEVALLDTANLRKTVSDQPPGYNMLTSCALPSLGNVDKDCTVVFNSQSLILTSGQAPVIGDVQERKKYMSENGIGNFLASGWHRFILLDKSGKKLAGPSVCYNKNFIRRDEVPSASCPISANVYFSPVCAYAPDTFCEQATSFKLMLEVGINPSFQTSQNSTEKMAFQMTDITSPLNVNIRDIWESDSRVCQAGEIPQGTDNAGQMICAPKPSFTGTTGRTCEGDNVPTGMNLKTGELVCTEITKISPPAPMIPMIDYSLRAGVGLANKELFVDNAKACFLSGIEIDEWKAVKYRGCWVQKSGTGFILQARRQFYREEWADDFCRKDDPNLEPGLFEKCKAYYMNRSTSAEVGGKVTPYRIPPIQDEGCETDSDSTRRQCVRILLDTPFEINSVYDNDHEYVTCNFKCEF